MSAFFAYGLQDGIGDSAYQSGDRLVYLNNRLNPGGYYNNVTGEYSCNNTGMYYFTYTIYGCQIEDGPSHSRATASLMKQGVKQGTVYATNQNTESVCITLGQSLILQCYAGEKVWVQSPYDKSHIIGSTYRNVFAGVLLFMY